MRIDAYNAVSQIYQTSNTYKAKAASNSYSSDKVEISSFGKEFQVAKAAVSQASDVREDKVNQIREMMAAGTYYVSGMDFANKMVEEYATEITF